MPDFTQDPTPLRGPHEDTEQSHAEYVRRTGGAASDERRRRIAAAAYRRAELRAFAPGYEEEDWLAAEKEIDATAIEQHWGTGSCS